MQWITAIPGALNFSSYTLVCVLTSKSIHNNGFECAMLNMSTDGHYHKGEEGFAFPFEFTIHHATGTYIEDFLLNGVDAILYTYTSTVSIYIL